MSTFPGTLKEQIPYAFLNLYNMLQKRRDRYKTDNERCSQSVLENASSPVTHCGAIMLHIEQAYLPLKQYKKYGLCCLGQLLKMDFSKNSQSEKSACIVFTSNLQNVLEKQRALSIPRWKVFRAILKTETYGLNCVKQLLKNRLFQWPRKSQVLYASNTPQSCKIC